MSEHDELKREQIGDAPPADRDALLAGLVILGGPAAFLVSLGLRYVLTDAACGRLVGRMALELAALPAVAAAGFAVWHGWRQLGPGRLDPIGESEEDGLRFAALLALLTGAVFLLAALGLWLPSLFLSPCQRG